MLTGIRCVFLPADWETRADKFSQPINTRQVRTRGTRPPFWNSSCAEMLCFDCTSCHMQLPINSWPVAVCPPLQTIYEFDLQEEDGDE